MKFRTLGNSNMHISRIGIGTWAMGGAWEWGWGPQDDQKSIDAIRYALSKGVNWIDTAPVYGLGHSEEVVGRAIKGLSEKPYLFTKCGLVWNEQKSISGKLVSQSIKKEVEASLTRLQVDVIDLYQIHWPVQAQQETLEGWATLSELVTEGKVRYIGVSNFNTDQLIQAGEISSVTSLQPPYNAINRDIEKSILPYCQENGIGTIVYSPMASGLLSGTMTKERIASLGEGDWRSRSENFKEPNLTKNLGIVERLREISEKKGCSIPEVAIAWTLHHPGVTAAITGMRNPEQVDGVIAASDLLLTEEEYNSIN